jgi:hypothetical protein
MNYFRHGGNSEARFFCLGRAPVNIEPKFVAQNKSAGKLDAYRRVYALVSFIRVSLKNDLRPPKLLCGF